MIQISKKFKFTVAWAAACILLLAAVPMFAQLPTGNILGAVKDATGGTVAGASVTVTNVDTGVSRTQMTGDDGAYRFSALPVGNYQVQVMKEGFETFKRTGLTLLVGQDIPIDVTLQVGATGQTVTVTGEAPQVNTTNATTGGVVDEQQVADLPLNGRNLIDLTLLQAGVVQTNVFSTLGNVVGATNIVGITFSSSGAPIHSNNFVLDGAIQTGQLAMNNSSIIGTTLGVDGIKEYKVVSSLPAAEYGLVMGATSTAVSKGGSNQWHGDAFDFLRNASMDARNYFDPLDTLNFNGYGSDKSAVFPGKRIPPFRRNNYGGAFGGPIKKDKTFFWAVYEGLSQDMGITISTNTLPGSCYNQTVGSPTYHEVTPTSFGGAQCTGVAPAQQVVTLPGGAGTTTNPALAYVMGTIFPNQPGVGLFPYPNTNIDALGNRLPGATFNYSFPYVQPAHENYGQMRIDQNFTANDSLFGRYTQDDANQIATTSTYQQVLNHESSSSIFATLSENHIFSPTVLNTLRYSVQRTVSIANISSSPNIPSQYLVSPQASDGEGFQVFGSVSPGQASLAPTGSYAITAYSASSGGDGTYIQNIYSYSDDIYWTKGKNAFKFGVDFNRYQVSQNQVFQQGGNLSFSNLANLAKGIYSGITTTGGTQFPLEQRYYHYGDYGFYAQDDLRATSRLTLNLGLRYEFATIPNDSNGLNYITPNVATANGLSAPNYGAVVGSMFGHNPYTHDVSPRIGFAYDPFGNGTTSIRGGAGIYYDIGGYGGLMLYEDCCIPPTSYSVIVTTSSTQASLPFPLTIPVATAPSAQGGATFYGGPNILTGAALPSPRNVDYNLKSPSMIEYNLTVDRQLPWAIGLSVGYVGSRGYHLATDTDANYTLPLGYLPNGLPYYCEAAVNPSIDPTCAMSTVASSPYFLKRLNPTFGTIVQYTDRSQSWYNSMQVNVNKRVTKGLSFSEALTWSKLLDNGQAQQPAEMNSLREQDILQPQYDIGPAGFNATWNSRLNVIYHAPNVTSDKLYMKALNGWWWSAIFSAQTGYPFEPTLPNRDFSKDSEDVDRPDLAANYNPSTVIIGKPTAWFNPAMFSIPTVGTYGNAGRDLLTGPGFQNLDFSMVKDTKVRWLGEQGNIEFRAEVFNILNHPNFSLPNAVIWSPSSPGTVPTFNGAYNPQIQAPGTIDPATNGVAVTAAPTSAGQITATNNRSRQIQLALKLAF